MDRYSEYKDSGIEWIGEVPTHWQQNRLGVLGGFSSSGIDKKSLEEERQVKMINYTTLVKNRTHTFSLTDTSDYMVTTTSERNISEHSVRVGDLIFLPSSETFEDLGLSSVVIFDESRVVYSYHVVRFRFKKKFDLGFKKYLCNHHGVLNQFSSKGKGTTRKILNRDSFKNTRVVFPPINEQTLISKYLDKKTYQIDSLIEKIERRIELLKEQRTSLINQCVTKGLNPNVEMKDSGVEWIGKIPNHWSIGKIYQYGSLVNGSTPSRKEPSYWENGTIPWMNSGEINKRIIKNIDGRITEKGQKNSSTPFLDVGAVMVALNGQGKTKGTVGILETKTTCNQSLCGISFKKSIEPKYQFYYLESQYKPLRGLVGDSKREGISVSFLSRYPVLVPPLQEQTIISKYLDKKTSQIDPLIEKETKRTELLKEYRQSLISNTVTGKIRITEDMI